MAIVSHQGITCNHVIIRILPLLMLLLRFYADFRRKRLMRDDRLDPKPRAHLR